MARRRRSRRPTTPLRTRHDIHRRHVVCPVLDQQPRHDRTNAAATVHQDPLAGHVAAHRRFDRAEDAVRGCGVWAARLVANGRKDIVRAAVVQATLGEVVHVLGRRVHVAARVHLPLQVREHRCHLVQQDGLVLGRPARGRLTRGADELGAGEARVVCVVLDRHAAAQAQSLDLGLLVRIVVPEAQPAVARSRIAQWLCRCEVQISQAIWKLVRREVAGAVLKRQGRF
eukprot:scaffold836_cov123-Isochrysis_galbana.AAC.13